MVAQESWVSDLDKRNNNGTVRTYYVCMIMYCNVVIGRVTYVLIIHVHAISLTNFHIGN